MIVLACKLSPLTDNFLRGACLNKGDQWASFAQRAGAFADVNERLFVYERVSARMRSHHPSHCVGSRWHLVFHGNDFGMDPSFSCRGLRAFCPAILPTTPGAPVGGPLMLSPGDGWCLGLWTSWDVLTIYIAHPTACTCILGVAATLKLRPHDASTPSVASYNTTFPGCFQH